MTKLSIAVNPEFQICLSKVHSHCKWILACCRSVTLRKIKWFKSGHSSLCLLINVQSSKCQWPMALKIFQMFHLLENMTIQFYTLLHVITTIWTKSDILVRIEDHKEQRQYLKACLANGHFCKLIQQEGAQNFKITGFKTVQNGISIAQGLWILIPGCSYECDSVTPHFLLGTMLLSQPLYSVYPFYIS